MRNPPLTTLTICAGILFSGLCSVSAATADQTVSTPTTERSEQIVKAAEALLATLDAAQKSAVLFKFNDEEQRLRWSNLPTGIFSRKGLRTGDLTPQQLEAVMNVVKATLSEEGYQQVVENVDSDEVLNEGGARGRVVFGKDEYYFSILGEPSSTEPWMWQFGGHHLAINATIIGERITIGPSLTGGQPMTYSKDGNSIRQMDNEIPLAFQLMNSLTEEQKKKAVIEGQVGDLALGPGRDDVRPAPQGIRGSDLTASQQDLLKKLLAARIGLLNADCAATRLAEAEKDLADTWFAWRGPTTPGSAAYYRVQGPVVFMEFSPQQMGGNASEHIHAMYREFGNDYGLKWVKELK